MTRLQPLKIEMPVNSLINNFSSRRAYYSRQRLQCDRRQRRQSPVFGVWLRNKSVLSNQLVNYRKKTASSRSWCIRHSETSVSQSTGDVVKQQWATVIFHYISRLNHLPLPNCTVLQLTGVQPVTWRRVDDIVSLQSAFSSCTSNLQRNTWHKDFVFAGRTVKRWYWCWYFSRELTHPDWPYHYVLI